MTPKRLDELRHAVVKGKVKRAKAIAEQIVAEGLSIDRAVDTLLKAMKFVDQLYEKKEYFVVEVASAASAMREAFKVFEPNLKVELTMAKGKVVIGSLKGNVQGLGKDIVAATLRAAGFHVVNLGVDVTPEKFVKTAIRENAQIIGISISMEETIPYLKDVVDLLKKENLRDTIKIIIGGNAVSEGTRADYGIDAYASNAQESVKKVEALLR